MEFIKQITVIIVFLVFCSCSTTNDQIVMQDMTPLPRSLVSQTAVEYEPVYTVLRIVEISEVNGVQKYFMVRMGTDRTGIERGAEGEIAETAAFDRVVGTFKILEIEGNFFRAEITELQYRIGSNAHIRIQIGEVAKQ